MGLGTSAISVLRNTTQDKQPLPPVSVTFNTPRPTPAQAADALIKSLGLSDAELTAFRQDTGVDLRQSYIDGFRRTGIDYNAVHYAGRDPQTNAPRYTGNIGVPAEFRQRIAEYADRDANAAPLPPQDSRAANNGATTTAQGQELTARGAMLRRRLERRQEINDVKRELLGLPDTATTLGAASTIALNRLPQVARTAAPVLPEVAPVVLPAAISVGGAALIINGQLDSAIERYLDTQRTAPPPPLQMSDAEDAPPLTTPTDTATRPTQPDVQATPEGGALTRPAPATPTTTTQPINNQPSAPQTPQGEPPRFDFKRGIPTAITTASLGKLAADKMNEAEGLKVPQGLTEAQFEQLSARVRESAGHYGSDIRVHGSRAAGTAKPNSDIDIAIRVSPERFDQIIRERFGTPNAGSAAERTMQHAIETGKIHRRPLNLSALGDALEKQFGVEVDISVIREGGPFDQGPWTSLK